MSPADVPMVLMLATCGLLGVSLGLAALAARAHDAWRRRGGPSC